LPIESKTRSWRFADKESHRFSGKREGRDTPKLYGSSGVFSTGCRSGCSWSCCRNLRGLERCHLRGPPMRRLRLPHFLPATVPALTQTQRVAGCFTAGAIQWPAYEEAAPGLVAGLNAPGCSPPGRVHFPGGQAYIGTLIDDLVSEDLASPMGVTA